MSVKFLNIFLALLCVLPVMAQQFTDEEIGHGNYEIIPRENIYIQTDKEAYKLSDIIWFKAYILDETTQRPSLKNTTLFVTLKNKATDKVVFEAKYKIVNGFSQGDIFLKEDLESGDFYLAAYTASSVVDNTSPVVSFKTITIKENEANLLMESQFNKDVYSENSNLKVRLTFYNNNGMDYFNEKVKIYHYNNNNNNKILASKTLVTNDKGIINMTLDKAYVSPSVRTEIKINNKKKDVFDLNIPFVVEKKVLFDLFPEGGKMIYNLRSKVAYKVTNTEGMPIKAKAELLEDDKYIVALKTFHDGMGFFNFVPKKGSRYKIRLVEPFLQIIDLPIIEDTGYALSLIKNSEDFLKISLSKSKILKTNEVVLVIQSKGLVCWSANVKLKEASVLVKIPKKNLPKGIVELTMYSKAMQPLAERLIYTNTIEELQIRNLNSLEDKYSNKEQIVLRLKVEDKYGKPIRSNLGLRVYDNAFYSSNNMTDIQSHYHLFSNLKGSIHKPLYYFNSANKHRLAHLDLLLLTHGWRNFVYSKDNLKTFKTNGKNKLDDIYRVNIFELDADNKLVNLSEPVTVNLVYPTLIKDVTVLKDGLLEVPLTESEIIFINIRGSKLYFFDGKNPFKVLSEITKSKAYKASKLLDNTNKQITKKELVEYFAKNSNFLNEVIVKGSKNRKALVGNDDKRWYTGSLGSIDYVCESYDVLNCRNHTIGGYAPIDGMTYNSNSGRRIIYRATKIEKLINENDLKKKGFQYVKGYKFKKEFFSPNYDTEKKEIIDIRSTLAWAPNLITDENGFINYTFYTSEINSSFTVHIEGVDGNGNIGSEFFKFSVRPNFE